MDHVQTKREIERALTAAGVRPRKRFGQHFLIDGNLMRRIADAADISQSDIILEVGAGTGGLTDLLLARAKRVVAVEIDTHLQGILKSRYADNDRFTLIAGDVLDGKHRLNPAVIEHIDARPGEHQHSAKLVANLPYQIATPLIMNLLIDYPAVRRFVFTVQKEVADRITASHGGKAFGPLGILCQVLSNVATTTRISPQSFWPMPAVDSVMLRLDVGAAPFPDRDTLRRFASLVRGTFEHRRKTLRSALAYVLDEGTRDRINDVVDASRRPESFSIDEWLRIFESV